MLLPFLSRTGIALSLVISATAESLPRLDIEQASIVPPSTHEVILPCAKCAFSEDPQCSEAFDRDSYLTINFSTENSTLLANQDAIFPSFLPLEFSAIRHNGTGQDEEVRLSYALDARPVPRSPNARLGEVYLLKLKLLDAFGRLASDHIVLVGLTTSTTSGSSLLTITEVNTSPLPRPHHHHPRPHLDNPQSWLLATIHTLKSTAKECLHVLTHPPPPPPPPPPPHHHHHPESNDNTLPSHPDSESGLESDPHRTIAPAGTHPHHGHRSHPYWHGHSMHRGFGRLVRPVILPALLGAVAGVMACVVGFLLGRVVVMVYYCVFGGERRRREIVAGRTGGRAGGRGRKVRVPVIMVQDADVYRDGGEEGIVESEKERLRREWDVRDGVVA